MKAKKYFDKYEDLIMREVAFESTVERIETLGQMIDDLKCAIVDIFSVLALVTADLVNLGSDGYLIDDNYYEPISRKKKPLIPPRKILPNHYVTPVMDQKRYFRNRRKG